MKRLASRGQKRLPKTDQITRWLGPTGAPIGVGQDVGREGCSTRAEQTKQRKLGLTNSRLANDRNLLA